MSATTTPPRDPAAMPVQYVRGIGPRKSAALAAIGVHTVLDLFLYVPRRYLDRSDILTIAVLRRRMTASGMGPLGGEAEEMEIRQDVTVVGEVRAFRVLGTGPKSRFVLDLADETGSLQCVWFGGVQFWRRAFQIGETIAVSGQPSAWGGIVQFVHPDVDRIAPPHQGTVPHAPVDEGEDADEGPAINWAKTLNTGGLVPVYPSGQDLVRIGLDSAGFRRILASALRMFAEQVVEVLPRDILDAHQFLPLGEALRAIHFPRARDELDEAVRRLKYHELFLFQLKLALKRYWIRHDTGGIGFNVKSALARQLVDGLPFTLTQAQVRVIREIADDMQNLRPMNRLLQGDVGSGKTIVALTAMLVAVENGYQALFMAPTEILAEQHYSTLSSLLKGLPVTIRLLIGAQKGKIRREILDDIRSGSAQIVVGTHALFEKGVEFARLGFVVIDEQHRFGVMQRALVRQKGTNPDVLIMTATPIPRTLSLTLYGDLDVSIIDEMPRDRKRIRTTVVDDSRKEQVYAFVREQIRQGRQAYFVYPLIEESEKLDLKAATSHFEHLQNDVFPDLRLGLMHGRLPTDEKDRVMAEFNAGEIDILVSTTVIEVGIDVPNASIMVIENAERFGLAQLHQLRGRVGRGAEQSYCILLTKAYVASRANRMRTGGEEAMADQRRLAERRLATIAQTTDGFAIADVDLEIRGPGDFFGTRQSGIPEFRVANIITDTETIHRARADAFALVERDPRLQQPAHRTLALHLRSIFHEDLSLIQVG